ncbi:phosphoinositide 3-kinase adapter protein 1 isoform X2 [Nasonia vitripennis]|uniref:DBB domain-containing protein n=1 Tax=Nasonia vitripennis TaxID=7425 RepID=A0A7M7QTR6_NASVI|nr:phosphoinositide 3-kinase adapter protein 1 isoform X2 [Nasonia vitripennis]XP_032454386.1 phosphoinositide 3-kinase adapter protein 1 isoform X2 [Nasonia vitripennis]
MAVDNPSYFSLRGAADASSSGDNSHQASGSVAVSSSNTSRGFGGFFRRSNKSVNNKAACGSLPQNQPSIVMSPRSERSLGHHQRRSLRSLFRSASASADCEKTRQFLKGEPRPSDVAPPSPYLNGRSHVHSELSRQHKGARRNFPKSTSELLNMDMIFCGLPGENGPGSLPVQPRRCEENDYYRFERDSDCGSDTATLTLDDVDNPRSYYNLTATLPSLGSPMYSSMGRPRRQAYQQQQLTEAQQKRHRRRHSIGTFLDRDKCAVGSSSTMSSRKSSHNGNRSTDLVVEPDVAEIAEDCPRIAARLARHDRIGTRHAPGTFASKPAATNAATAAEIAASSRDDVVFVSIKDNEAAALWVNYLTACFEQISRQQGRPPFRVSQIQFEEPLTPAHELKIRTSRLQIVVVCPVFMERVSERQEQASQLSRQLSSERVLAMMLGVQESQLTGRAGSLVGCQTWRKFFVKDQDETFVGQFLGAAVAILGSSVASNNLKIDKTGFSVHPKKVKTGQNRILALLNEPLQPDDSVVVTVDRCGEAIEVSHVKRRNPYTLQFSIPERCLDVSMLVGVRIARNGTALGVRQVKCESRLRELDQILRAHDNPLEFMCQTFGFNPGDREQLDNWMVHAFQKNIPPHFNLLSNPPGSLQLSKNHSSSEENPTLLHFAARFGLEKLAWQLLECPGGDIACDMRNANDYTPADLAEQAGHVRLAHQLRGYMQMNEFSNMYSYLKVMSENTNGSANGYRTPMHHHGERLMPMAEEACSSGTSTSCSRYQEDYCRPRPLSEAYSVPPTARPVTAICRTFPDYSTPPPLPQPNPVVPASTAAGSEDSGSATPTPLAAGYASSSSTLNASNLELPLQGLRSPDSVASTPSLSSSQQLISQSPAPETPTADGKSETSSDQQSNAGKSSSLGRSSNKSSSRESPQDELLEIITDFKNNVFTISEVERLVENWRNRNDVQQSFKDKQRQLSAMRDEYERIQKRIKDEMKAPTPFDRIRKFFTKGKKDSKDPAGTSEDAASSKQNGVGGNLADRRPVSSLSLHSVSSSSSSGRMSTVSGCSGTSLGDSGTHSDTEDRRHPVAEDKASGMTSYEIPPAPKPFHGRIYQQNPHQQHHQPSRYTPQPSRAAAIASTSELDLRPVKSSHSTVDDKEYYISFPPSGLPIHSFRANGSTRDLKTPSTPIDASREFLANCDDGKSNQINYADVSPILIPPPGMCIPFQYVNIAAQQPTTDNVLTIQPEIHAEPSKPLKIKEEIDDDDDSSENDTDNENADKVEEKIEEPESPKILNTDQETATQVLKQVENVPDYTNVQVAASEEIARNFGVTLKKLPAPPVPPRCEFSFAEATTVTEKNSDE